MVTPAMKTIKITADDHRRLKLMAAKSGEHVYEVVGRLLKFARAVKWQADRPTEWQGQKTEESGVE